MDDWLGIEIKWYCSAKIKSQFGIFCLDFRNQIPTKSPLSAWFFLRCYMKVSICLPIKISKAYPLKMFSLNCWDKVLGPWYLMPFRSRLPDPVLVKCLEMASPLSAHAFFSLMIMELVVYALSKASRIVLSVASRIVLARKTLKISNPHSTSIVLRMS